MSVPRRLSGREGVAIDTVLPDPLGLAVDDGDFSVPRVPLRTLWKRRSTASLPPGLVAPDLPVTVTPNLPSETTAKPHEPRA